ncbi:MAG: thioredoxin family protein [Magnetovibrio sp.]|nr:thioredoxin family protein [Magnetovibrio sp.]
MSTFRWIIAAILLITPAILTPQSVQSAELVYFGSSYCSVCETWEQEIGDIYPKTSESKVLPLRYHDIHDVRPKDIKFVRGIIYTPTFVAIEDGKEIGRIVGYMGDFFFWEQIGSLAKKAAGFAPKKISACPQNSEQLSSFTC